MGKLSKKDRDAIKALVDSADYQNAVDVISGLLRSHLLSALGGNWEKLHYEYGLYVINCRAKSARRILDKAHHLAKDGKAVCAGNFFTLMPDLVGARLVAIDPGDLFQLAELVRTGFTAPEFLDPVPPFKKLRVRHGRFSVYDSDPFEKVGYVVEEEHTGYGSVHLVYKTGPQFYRFCDQDVLARIEKLGNRIPPEEWHIEIQVRTIMDEAWGEVDHFVRYEDPELRDDPNLTTHFAALAGFLQAANHHVKLIRDLARRMSSS